MNFFTIRKIKTLKVIKPNKDWVLLTRNNILEKAWEPRQQKLKEAEGVFFALFHKPVFITSALVVAFLAFLGIMVINIQPVQELSVSEYKLLTLSLRDLEASLSHTTVILKDVKDPARVLKTEEIVSSTIEKGEEFVSNAKKLKENNEPAEVLAALMGVEGALNEMKEASWEVQKQIVERELGELKQRSLSEIQQGFVKEAEIYYNKENYPQALAKIIEASQIR